MLRIVFCLTFASKFEIMVVRKWLGICYLRLGDCVMPVEAVKRHGKWRVVEVSSGQIATNKKGTSIDGGGHATVGQAVAQVQAVNISLRKHLPIGKF